MTASDQQRPRLLLVDDDPAAILLTRIALQESALDVRLDSAKSFREGEERLRTFAQTPEQAPALVLLDLNLGDGSGHDLLAFMKQEPALASIPVVVLSTSSYPKDLERATRLGAADYLVKPNSFDELVRMMNGLARHLR